MYVILVIFGHLASGVRLACGRLGTPDQGRRPEIGGVVVVGGWVGGVTFWGAQNVYGLRFTVYGLRKP